MKYFISNGERHGTCYHEYIQGEWDGKTFWADNSLYLHDDVMCELNLYHNLFSKAIPDFDCYRDMVVTRDDWEHLMQIAQNSGGKVAEFVDELRPWAEDNFQKHEIFTILGI